MVHIVTIQNHKYSPSPLTIQSGDSVQWANNDGIRHSARRDGSPVFNTGLISKGKESPEILVEAAPGSELEYYCEPHPHMRGTIIIAAPPESAS